MIDNCKYQVLAAERSKVSAGLGSGKYLDLDYKSVKIAFMVKMQIKGRWNHTLSFSCHDKLNYLH